MREDEGTFMGISPDGFRAATEAAVREYEEENGIPEEPVKLRVVEMYVTVHNPIHDYRVVLGPSG
jgi:8-oxo-dGTP pyrophosphatase MutT (NUDIX family)